MGERGEVWFVASGNPGTRSFLERECVAVNFYVRADAAGRSPEEIATAAVGAHPDWDGAASGTRTRFARQLATFSRIRAGDQVMTFDRGRRHRIFVGKVTGAYRYEPEPGIPEHPHVLPVEWIGTVDRSELPDAGASIPSRPGVTVAPVYEETIAVTGPVEQAVVRSTAPPRGRSGRRRRLAPDGFVSEPTSGAHRYRLVQTFERTGEPVNPFTVVMLNPAKNELAGFRASTTCHRVRAWGIEHGYDGALYVNLFSHIQVRSGELRHVPPGELNGPDADAAIADVGGADPSVLLAGWGDLPAGFNRVLYDTRVTEVEALIGHDLCCLGFTGNGYPLHGMHWKPHLEPMPLRPRRA